MSKDRSRPARVADSKQGQYSDGHPLDEVQYLECKLILKPDRFTAAKVFLDYGKLVANGERFWRKIYQHGRGPKARDPGSGVLGYRRLPALQQCIYLTTSALRLRSGRHQRASRKSFSSFATRTCRRSRRWTCGRSLPRNYRIKFKGGGSAVEGSRWAGYRLLYSHNAQFPLSQAPEGDRRSMGTLARVFPALEALRLPT